MPLRLCSLLLVATCIVALIPREKLISDSPNAASHPSLSPDGKVVGYTAPDENKIINVFTMRLDDMQKRQVTFEKRDVRGFLWTSVENVIVFEQDNKGDENIMLFKKNISENAATHEHTIISNARGVRAEILAQNNNHSFVLVSMNDLNPEYHSVYKFDLYTNERTLIFNNTRFPVVYVDNDLKIRLAAQEQEDGSKVYYRVSDSANSKILSSDHWVEYLRVREDDPITAFVGFDRTNDNVYWIWGEKADLGELILAPFDDFSKKKVLYTPTRGEITDGVFHPADRTLLVFSEYYHKPELVFADASVAGDLQYLEHYRPNESLKILKMSQDLQTWLIAYVSSEKPNEYFIYRRPQNSVQFLFRDNAELEVFHMNRKIGFDFIARDGLKIQAYLSLPLEATLKSADDVPEEDREFAEQGMIPAEPQKMVLLVHGGPHVRDDYDFDVQTAYLTSRGYAVMQTNYRGSAGFGKHFYNAINGEFSRKAHDDLIDAVEFAVSKGIANRSAVAIMGGSYGGYSTLVGLTFTPDVFACGVDIVGMSSLISTVNEIPPHWRAWRASLVKLMGGDPDTEEGRQELIARSPLYFADRVKKPLLIMQGANDPRVKQQEAEQFVSALKNHSIPVTYVLYPDEGHGFKRIPNKLAQYGFVEKFLNKCLGGEYQPFTVGQYNETAIVKSDDFALFTGRESMMH